jgi:hypothetical protein
VFGVSSVAQAGVEFAEVGATISRVGGQAVGLTDHAKD